MTQNTKTKETRTVEDLISLFESISGEALWRDGQHALGSTIVSLLVAARNEEDPKSFMLAVATKLQNEYTEIQYEFTEK
jgi:hypothetical protein